MIVVEVVLWVLLVLVGLVVVLLVMPLHYRAEGAVDDEGHWWRARVAWGFGLVAVHAGPAGFVLRLLGVPVYRRSLIGPKRDQPDKPKRDKPNEDAKAASQKAQPVPARGPIGQMMRARMMVGIAGRYVRALHITGRLEGVVGLRDPDRTAMLHQVLVIVGGRLPDGLLDVEVDWVEEVVELRCRVGGWGWPLQIVGISLAWWLDGETRRALRAA